MKNFFLFLVSLVAFSPLFAQTAIPPAPQPQQQEVIVRIQNEQPKAIPQSTVVEKAHEWVQFGEHVGKAIDAGLGSLTEHANKFADTDAGRFTMLVIAWKVAGQDAMTLLDRFTGVAVGVPSLIAWCALCIWYIRRMFVRHTIVIEKSGFLWWGTKKYKVVNDEHEWGSDKTAGMFVAAIVFIIGCAVLVFAVIL